MRMYELMYRFRVTPWERYIVASAGSVRSVLDREEATRSRPLGRALDLGCGRGVYSAELARRGWEVVGVDNVPRAIEGAKRRGIAGATFLLGDVTDLPAVVQGDVDFFFDVGCFQHLDAPQRAAYGRGVTALARPGATLLMLEFGASPWRSLLGGVSRREVETAFPGWETVSVEDAERKGLGWPLTRMSPRWYRLGLRPIS